MMQFRRPLALWRAPPWPGDASARDAARLPIILLYHSIENVRSDPWGVRVRPRNFIEHMAVIRAHCHPMRLADLDATLRSGNVPPRSVIVTFDDGYVDNLLHAKPAMERYGVPGTVFVSSGYAGAPQEYWWDELDRLLLQPGVLPQHLEITVAGRTLSWDLGDAGRYGRFRAWKHRHWFAWQDASGARQRIFLEIWKALREAPTVEDREQALEQLRRAARPAIQTRATHRCCTREQVRELGSPRGGLIEIGAHTANHPSLGYIGVAEQRREIVESKAALEEILQSPVESFAYPFGSRSDYSADTIALLKESGFKRACSNFPAPLMPAVDRFQYPRRVVMDWNGTEFAARLARWFAEDARAAGDSRENA